MKTETVSLLDKFRSWLLSQPVLWLFVITFGVVALIAPAKVGLLLWGICKLAAFAFAANWIDDRVFPNARPDDLSGAAQGTAWKRKSLIVAAGIVAGALLP